ncbi:MAG: response regulator [Chthoniobacteraceae bacterium]
MESTYSSEKTGDAPFLASGRSAVAPAASTRVKVMRSAEELEKALVSIRQARDLVITRNLELSSELGIAQDRILELEDERGAADQSRDSALQLVQEISLQNDELRNQSRSLADENASLQAAARDLEAQSAPATVDDSTSIDALRRDLAEAEAVVELLKSQQAKQAAALAQQLASAHRARDIAVESVTNAQRQVERLAAERRDLQAQIEADRATFEARISQLASQIPTPAQTAPAPEAESVDAWGSFVTENSTVTAELIRGCIQSLVNDPADHAALAELDERFHGCAASASGLGHGGIARFSSACGELTRWLCRTPLKVKATLPTLRDAAEILSALSALSDPGRIADPAGALVYSVDDDVDNCECISMSLEKMSLRTRYAMKPEIALAELSGLPCDIITLDVDLGSTDGFALSARIREMARHGETPIIFLSGLMSTKERLATLSGGPYHFVPKPYNLNELGVIALGTILTARLAKDAGPATVLRIV